MGYFSSLISTYSLRNDQTLHEMCRYLNSHIGATSEPSIGGGLIQNQQFTPVKEHDDDVTSEVFSVKQFNSNTTHQSQLQQADSRPSFGNSYVNNFIREEEE